MINSSVGNVKSPIVKMSANVMLLSVFWKYGKKNLFIFVCDAIVMTMIDINRY